MSTRKMPVLVYACGGGGQGLAALPGLVQQATRTGCRVLGAAADTDSTIALSARPGWQSLQPLLDGGALVLPSVDDVDELPRYRRVLRVLSSGAVVVEGAGQRAPGQAAAPVRRDGSGSLCHLSFPADPVHVPAVLRAARTFLLWGARRPAAGLVEAVEEEVGEAVSHRSSPAQAVSVTLRTGVGVVHADVTGRTTRPVTVCPGDHVRGALKWHFELGAGGVRTTRMQFALQP
ncbi:hypothetical protein ACFVIM_23630 [Streptomyces sp. NPDC057638]|uniref:hypothetical protein n=1 Tax=Streptomyces sp. NPDC057638 TaxID=3346190 RepID=UPI0036A2FEE8